MKVHSAAKKNRRRGRGKREVGRERGRGGCSFERGRGDGLGGGYGMGEVGGRAYSAAQGSRERGRRRVSSNYNKPEPLGSRDWFLDNTFTYPCRCRCSRRNPLCRSEMGACAQWCKNLGSYGGLVQGLWQFYAVEQDVVQGRAGQGEGG